MDHYVKRAWKFFLLGAVLFTACHAKRPPREPLDVRLLVVDFSEAEEIKSNPREIKGWWFGSRDVYRNPNTGEIFADIFSKRIDQQISCVDSYSRTDLKYYMANKKDRLKKQFPELEENEIDQLFSDISVCDFAKDLQIDMVLIGKLNQCHTSHNRTIHWWSSVVDVDAILLDAETCEPEWSGRIAMRKNFRSQYGAMEKAAERLIKQMKREYFYK